MQEKEYKKLEKRIREIETKYESLENYVLRTTNIDDKHKMRMKEYYSFIFSEIEEVYRDLSDLEFADLLDFENIIGRSDGKSG